MKSYSWILLLAVACGDDQPISPLHEASRNDDVAAIRSLLESGADIDELDVRNGWTPLMHAVHKNAEGAVRVLLESGAGVDFRAASGRTALIMAAGYGQEANVRALLSHGADPDARAKDGTNALWAAAGGGAVTDVTDGPPIGSCFPEVVNLLLQTAPDTRLPEGYATGALRWLARSEDCRKTIASLTAE